MKNKFLVLIIALTLAGGALFGQENSTLVQFSGMVLDGTTNQMFPVPYTNILVKEKGRGTYSDFDGFFSIVVEEGDIIVFSALGYKTVEFQIPENLKDDRYSLVQLMTKDAVNLPETVVFPWPSKEHFKLEFLAMDVTSELQAKASENIANETLERMRNAVVSDGVENTGFYLRQQARKTYYVGQTPPMNIFNPVAWKDFFDAWKRGDFKKKKTN
ncbi:MAG: carboxypeptidase-like regulatory domain-containing protein [Saprospiraceae bacterium]|nr:carboxypeptidase-like regulatory domain-containing protein [Saprospiraceae bacterium]MCB9324736.1 carboxypeptidase-like regulatory domain-containing protein [Lewinellaceae bacterium]